MTAPAVSLYQQEMAKRGLSLVKATGCPRIDGPTDPKLAAPTRRRPNPVRLAQTARRNADLVRWYTSGLTLEQVAAKSKRHHGKRAIADIGWMSRVLRREGVTMRKQGRHQRVAMLKEEVARLRERLAHYELSFAAEEDA